jgi:hypothetical protein
MMVTEINRDRLPRVVFDFPQLVAKIREQSCAGRVVIPQGFRNLKLEPMSLGANFEDPIPFITRRVDSH